MIIVSYKIHQRKIHQPWELHPISPSWRISNFLYQQQFSIDPLEKGGKPTHETDRPRTSLSRKSYLI